MRSALLVGLIGVSLVLVSCAVGPDFHRPPAPAAHDYGAAPLSGELLRGDAQQFVASMDVAAQWWTLFGSEDLNHLVMQALKANPDINAAKAALRQAHELYLAQRTAYFPTVLGNFGATRSEYPTSTLTAPTIASSTSYNLYTAQLSVSYMPDVFGATRRSVEAARATEDSNRFQLEAVYLTLTSNVVVTAIQEAAVRAQIAVTDRLLQIQKQQSEIVRQQRALGTTSDLELFSQQAAEAQTAQMLPPLRKQLAQLRDALGALAGRLPSDEPPPQFALDRLVLPAQLPVSLPSALIAQRPDVLQAEANLHVASAAAGIALANMLPQFEIDAGAGSSALLLHRLFSPYTGFWDLGASLTQTLFDSGALLHRHRAADAALDQSAAQYRAAVLQACQNFADTLYALRSDAEAFQDSQQAQAAAKRAFELARDQYRLGAVSYINILLAEQSYQQAEVTLIQAQANRYGDTAALFQALGGGWWNRTGDAP